MIEYKKELIDSLIKRLEEIRDSTKIEDITIEPFHIAEEWKMIDGSMYGIGSQNITIKYEKMFVKQDEFEEWQLMK